MNDVDSCGGSEGVGGGSGGDRGGGGGDVGPQPVSPVLDSKSIAALRRT